MSATEPHQIYAAERATLVGQLRSLTDAQANTTVPTCPDWTVKDVAAHLSGLVAETLDDVPLPRGSAEATARQVGDRAAYTLAQVCDEWEQNGPALTAYAQSDPNFAILLTADLVVHSHDIAEALDIPIDEMSPGTVLAAERYLERLQQRAAERIDVAVNAELDGVGAKPSAEGATAIGLKATPFQFLRHVTGRRSPAEAAALEWSGDPTQLIASAFFQYGPNA